MTISAPSYLRQFHDQSRAIGAPAINSDGAFEIVGWESSWLSVKQFPWPEISSAGEIEVPTPLGSAMWEPQQIKVNQQGQVSLIENVAGTVDQLLVGLITNRSRFDAWVYEGTPQRYLRAKKIVNCFLQIDNPDRDWENRSQVLLFSGTLFFHYYGDTKAGNYSTY